MLHIDPKKTIYYTTLSDRVVEPRGDQAELPKNYRWIRRDKSFKAMRRVMLWAARLSAFVYCKAVLRVKVENKDLLKKMRYRGCFLYANYVHAPGDGLLPIYVNGAKPADILVDPEVLSTPILGKYLPHAGAMPIPKTMRSMRRLRDAIDRAIDRGHTVCIYPEGTLWPYYTDIRPFHKGSFRFPVESNAPCYSMTTTFQERKAGKPPKVTVYIDGPFNVPHDISRSEQQELLKDLIHAKMKERAKNNTIQYIRYEQK